MNPQSEIPEWLANKLSRLEDDIIALGTRLDKVEKIQLEDNKRIRANKEKGWFAYDRTQEHETEIEDIVRRIDILEEAEENRE